MPPFQQAMLKRAPVWLRRRLLLRLARRLVRSSYKGSRAISRLRARHRSRRCARVDLLHGPRAGAASAVRLLRAAFTRLLALFDISAAPRSSPAAAPASRRAC